MDKRGKVRWALIIGIILVVVLVIGAFFYFALTGPDYREEYESRISSGEIVNPAAGLTLEEAVAKFDESFVEYLLINIGAYNLHEPPLSNDKPKIEFLIDDEIYNAEVDDGEIGVERGQIGNEDAVIKTSTEEAVKMVQDADYVVESFRAGSSEIELVADKTTLFAKGYLSIYEGLTGEGITGSVVGIYLD